MTNAAMQKAFAVMSSSVHRWSVNSFYSVKWGWPDDLIKPLGEALNKRIEVIEKDSKSLLNLELIILHFDGEIERRNVDVRNFKGRLFKAIPGDMIYSKIDVRNGAIGIIPDEFGNVVVSSEFPVYQIIPSKALPLYIKLLFRCSFFRKAINNMISGASGRKRVQPTLIESMNVPLPAIETQQKIVNYWQKENNVIEILKVRKHHLRQEAEVYLSNTLGVSLQANKLEQKEFSLFWNKLNRWDIIFAKDTGGDYASSKYPTKNLRDLILPLNETNRRIAPTDSPTSELNYIGMENVEAETGRLVNFAPIRAKEV